MFPSALRRLIAEPPPPSIDDEGALALYWSRQAIDARAHRRRLRVFAGSAALVTVAVAIAILAFVVRIDPAALIVGLHAPFIAAALVLLAVPSWRRWMLPQAWSPILFIFAGYGVFYTLMFWPNALGGLTVALPLVLAMIAGVLIGTLFMFINEWRSDRRSAIEGLAVVVVVGASLVAAERFVGKNYWWLAIVPVLGYSGIRWLFDYWRASRRREPS